MEDKREQFGHDGLEGTSHSRRIRENEPVY